MLQLPTVTKNILIINVILWLATVVFQGALVEYLAAFYPTSPFFYPWQIVTHMFMHDPGGIGHIFMNMFALYVFGSYLERHWGPKKFLTYYLLTGLGAFFLHELINGIQIFQAAGTFWPSEGQLPYIDPSLWARPVLGASGAVFGLILAFALIFPNARLMLLFPPIPLKARTLAFILAGIELIQIVRQADDNVAHFAHLGGMLFGYIILKYWQKRGNIFH